MNRNNSLEEYITKVVESHFNFDELLIQLQKTAKSVAHIEKLQQIESISLDERLNDLIEDNGITLTELHALDTRIKAFQESMKAMDKKSHKNFEAVMARLDNKFGNINEITLDDIREVVIEDKGENTNSSKTDKLLLNNATEQVDLLKEITKLLKVSEDTSLHDESEIDKPTRKTGAITKSLGESGIFGSLAKFLSNPSALISLLGKYLLGAGLVVGLAAVILPKLVDAFIEATHDSRDKAFAETNSYQKDKLGLLSMTNGYNPKYDQINDKDFIDEDTTYKLDGYYRAPESEGIRDLLKEYYKDYTPDFTTIKGSQEFVARSLAVLDKNLAKTLTETGNDGSPDNPVTEKEIIQSNNLRTKPEQYYRAEADDEAEREYYQSQLVSAEEAMRLNEGSLEEDRKDPLGLKRGDSDFIMDYASDPSFANQYDSLVQKGVYSPLTHQELNDIKQAKEYLKSEHNVSGPTPSNVTTIQQNVTNVSHYNGNGGSST